MTIGVDFEVITVVSKGIQVKLQIWDTGGEEVFKSIVTPYYRGGGAFIVQLRYFY